MNGNFQWIHQLDGAHLLLLSNIIIVLRRKCSSMMFGLFSIYSNHHLVPVSGPRCHQGGHCRCQYRPNLHRSALALARKLINKDRGNSNMEKINRHQIWITSKNKQTIILNDIINALPIFNEPIWNRLPEISRQIWKWLGREIKQLPVDHKQKCTNRKIEKRVN